MSFISSKDGCTMHLKAEGTTLEGDTLYSEGLRMVEVPDPLAVH